MPVWVGWATKNAALTPGLELGNDEEAYTFNPFSHASVHNGIMTFTSLAVESFDLKVLIDLDRGEIYIGGVQQNAPLKRLFTNIDVTKEWFPCVTLSNLQTVCADFSDSSRARQSIPVGFFNAGRGLVIGQ